jgi:transcriptional regulator with XRE-family HTH domain
MDIKKVINDRGFTLQQVADALGISQQAVSQAVNGNPSLSRLRQIAEAIGVTVSQLVADDIDTASQSLIKKCPHCGKPINIKIENPET